MSELRETTQERSEIAQFLEKRLDEIKFRKTQKEVAFEIGYDKPNIVSMWKAGTAKVPFEKLYLLARSLDVDPALLLKLALAQNWANPGAQEAIEKIVGHIVTDNEAEIVRFIREQTKNSNPSLTPELQEKLSMAFTSRLK